MLNRLAQALSYPGPALVQAVVDPNEPPMPGKITTEQALHFAEALARGDKHAGKIIETVFKEQSTGGHLRHYRVR